MKATLVKDERITALLHKYSHHAFGILMTLLLISTLVKVFILQWDMKYWIDTFLILMVACAYVTFRCIKDGLFLFPSKQDEQKRLRKVNIISGAIAALLWGVLMFVFDMTDSAPVDITRSIIGNSVGAIVFFFGITGLQLLVIKVSNKNANKDLE
ncbi:DUF6773 family protein [uncultured Paenibacillus sp.]|uniref:DUF6773 family protein n=1 Tax=uncultured Paenibacillus sp. TaxID=227322 RepID=UPI0028D6DE92|nr:DUF6773 family protein [uncultured Paenibacillus sp.]